MRKIFIFLLILFLSNYLVFSQDGFSWDGSIRMGTMVDFVEDESTDRARIEPYGGDKRGEIGLNWVSGGLRLRTTFTGNFHGDGYEKDHGNVIFANEVRYIHPDNFLTFFMHNYIVFGRGGDKGALWFGGAFNDWERETPSHKGPTRMWLQYNALSNQALRIYAGYIGRDDGDIDDGFNGDWNVSDLVKDEKFNMNPIPGRRFPDQGAALQLNYSGFENLVFGVTFSGEGAFAGYKILPDADGVIDKTRYDFFRSFLWGHTIFGAKYALLDQQLNFGAMLGVDTPWSQSANKYGDTLYHAHLSANYRMKNGLYFHADIKGVDLEGDQQFFAGAGTSYWLDPFWLELKFRLRDINFRYQEIGEMENLIRVFGVETVFAWNMISESLQFRLPFSVNVDFTGQEITFYVGPGFYYNMNHNGATDDPTYGILFRYNMGYQITQPRGAYDHNLELSFRMAF